LYKSFREPPHRSLADENDLSRNPAGTGQAASAAGGSGYAAFGPFDRVA